MLAGSPAMVCRMSRTRLRPATRDDLDALLQIEQRCFASDRMSRRSFTRFIDSPGDALWVLTENRTVAGYFLMLFHRATLLARLYSIAVHPDARGQGHGRRLLERALEIARERRRHHVRLEVREDDARTIAMYEAAGFRHTGRVADYYEDGSTALRMERSVRPQRDPRIERLPYYAQTTGFTCGPAALMMAMRALDAEQPLDRSEELQLWREATTIYMMSGHGGCSPHGLALAAARRGFGVELYVNRAGPPFLDGVRDPEKRAVMKQVHADFCAGLEEAGIEVRSRAPSRRRLAERMAEGWIPVMLISTYAFSREKVPHWVTVAAITDEAVYLNDPEVNVARGRTALDNTNLPVPAVQFDRMSRFGRERLRSVILLGKR